MPFLAPVAAAAAGALASAGAAVATGAAAVGSAVGSVAGSVGSAIGTVAGTVAEGVGSAAGAIGEGASSIFGGVAEGAGGLAEGAGGLAQGAAPVAEAVAPQLASAGGQIGTTITDVGAELASTPMQSALNAPSSIQIPAEGLTNASFGPGYSGSSPAITAPDVASGGGFPSYGEGNLQPGQVPSSSVPIQNAPYDWQALSQGNTQGPLRGELLNSGGGPFEGMGGGNYPPSYGEGPTGFSNPANDVIGKGSFWDQYGENIKKMAASGGSGASGGSARQQAPPLQLTDLLSGWGSGFQPGQSPIPPLDYFMNVGGRR